MKSSKHQLTENQIHRSKDTSLAQWHTECPPGLWRPSTGHHRSVHTGKAQAQVRVPRYPVRYITPLKLRAAKTQPKSKTQTLWMVCALTRYLKQLPLSQPWANTKYKDDSMLSACSHISATNSNQFTEQRKEMGPAEFLTFCFSTNKKRRGTSCLKLRKGTRKTSQ